MQPSTTQLGWQGMESLVGMETVMLSRGDPAEREAESAEPAALRKQTCIYHQTCSHKGRVAQSLQMIITRYVIVFIVSFM